MNWMSEIFLSTLVNALTDRMPTTEDTVRSKTIVCASGHRNEVATGGVVTTILDLLMRRVSIRKSQRVRRAHIKAHIVEQ